VCLLELLPKTLFVRDAALAKTFDQLVSGLVSPRERKNQLAGNGKTAPGFLHGCTSTIFND
jgi:hypothetical protein